MTAVITFFSVFKSKRELPVVLHHAPISDLKPLSVEVTSIMLPSFSSAILEATFIIGPGHCRPEASTLITSAELDTAACVATLCGIVSIPFLSFTSSLYKLIPPHKE